MNVMLLALDDRRARGRAPIGRISWLRIGDDAGHQHGVQQPRDVRERRGHQHRVGRREPVRVRHDPGLVREAALRVQRGLRPARGARGEQHDGEVGPDAPPSRVTGAPASSNASNRALGPRTSSRSPGTLRARGSRACARRRPAPRGGGSAPRSRRAASTRGRAATTSYQFGACQATTSPRRTPACAQPPGERRRPCASSARPSRRTLGRFVDRRRSPAARRAAVGEQRVERRDVPRAAGRAVARAASGCR